jgi:hypothetical protein
MYTALVVVDRSVGKKTMHWSDIAIVTLLTTIITTISNYFIKKLEVRVVTQTTTVSAEQEYKAKLLAAGGSLVENLLDELAKQRAELEKEREERIRESDESRKHRFALEDEVRRINQSNENLQDQNKHLTDVNESLHALCEAQKVTIDKLNATNRELEFKNRTLLQKLDGIEGWVEERMKESETNGHDEPA